MEGRGSRALCSEPRAHGTDGPVSFLLTVSWWECKMSFLSAAMKEPNQRSRGPRDKRSVRRLIDFARGDTSTILQQLNTSVNGLTSTEAEARLEQYGPNDIAREKPLSAWARLFGILRNPLVILLAVLAIVSFATENLFSAIMIICMIAIAVVLRFFQERRADKAAEKLKAMVHTTATVWRDGEKKEIELNQVVPGDIVTLSAGDMVPADVRILSAKDLFINQAALTGESLPVEKTSVQLNAQTRDALEMPNVCFLGSNVESGTATGVVALTGSDTYFGTLAGKVVGQVQVTSFEKGVNSFTWLMITFMLVMVPLVLLLNGLTKHDWVQALLFALAVAVGLTPELLPMIVTVNLAKGAITMSSKKVIVKRLSGIQNFGAMDVLCTDKTGTITLGRIILEKHLDIWGRERDEILEYAYLNSYFQTGLKNLMDVAVLKHADLEKRIVQDRHYRRIDEVPFDFVRKRMTVVVEDKEDQHTLICKGAPEQVVPLCTQVGMGGKAVPLMPAHKVRIDTLVRNLNADGFRVVALSCKMVSNESDNPVYSVRDEADLILLGFLAFLDPPKETAAEALRKLNQHGIAVKILTGDNDIVTSTICRHVGLPAEHILVGSAIEGMSDEQLQTVVEETTVFAKLAPTHKERIIRALQRRRHVVGFLGDGINDAPALKAADVGISVDTAVDVAKESSDIILLETSLLVLEEGVIEGRKVFGNIIKYLRMAASSNFGNMFSVLGASIFLPFLPMEPLQVLVNNLLYDFSQTTIPTDKVDQEWIAKPRKWSIGNIRRFILFIGPVSSIFDYATFFLMLYFFKTWSKPDLFHTGWFVESIFTQTLIVHVIRTNKIPFIQSRASLAMICSTLIIVGAAAGLVYSPLAHRLGFTPLPAVFWLFLLAMLISYVVLTQIVKTWFIRKFGEG